MAKVCAFNISFAKLYQDSSKGLVKMGHGIQYFYTFLVKTIDCAISHPFLVAHTFHTGLDQNNK